MTRPTYRGGPVLMTDEQRTQECRIEFENGVTRNTSIRFFIERAIEDDEAAAFLTDTDEELTDIEQALVEVSA